VAPRLGLTLRSIKYTDSELWVKDGLERLFWIEIAKRKARLMDSRVFDAMLALSGDVAAWFEDHGPTLSEPLDDGADAFWNTVQYGYDGPFARHWEQRAVLDQAMALFGDRGRHVMRRLPCRQGFLLADFTVVTNFVSLHDWWQFISTSDGRKFLKSEGLFSSIGEPHPVVATEELRFAGHAQPTVSIGEKIITVKTLPNPVRIPRRLTSEKVRTWTTDEHDVTVDGHPLNGHLLLDFDLSKPMPSIREVEYALRAAFSAQRFKRWDAMLASGTITTPTLLDENELRTEDMSRLLLPPVEEHKLMLAQNSARPLIFGLHCWDLIHAGLSKTEAATQALKDLQPGLRDYSVRRVLYGVKSVQQRIEAYDPASLPWND
jgi:hypothetical protein